MPQLEQIILTSVVPTVSPSKTKFVISFKENYQLIKTNLPRFEEYHQKRSLQLMIYLYGQERYMDCLLMCHQVINALIRYVNDPACNGEIHEHPVVDTL